MINTTRGITTYFLTYNSVDNQSATFALSSSPSETPVVFGIDPSSGLLCTNTLDGLTALFADQPATSGFGVVSFDTAVRRAGDPSYIDTGVTAVINSDLSLNLTNQQSGNNQTYDCHSQLSLRQGPSLGCGMLTLFAVPIAGVPTTTTTTTTYATTTVTPTPSPRCTAVILQAVGGGVHADGLYARVTEQQYIQFTSTYSAATTFTIDSNRYLSYGGAFYANIYQSALTNPGVNAWVTFNTQANITRANAVNLVCSIGTGSQMSCPAGNVDTFEVGAGGLYMAGRMYTRYPQVSLVATTIDEDAACPS